MRYCVLPFSCAMALLWPLFIDSYRLGGGAGHEILMNNILKAQFNKILLSGVLPMWNEWMETGKVFLIFGTYPLNFFTPLELVAGSWMGNLLPAIEALLLCILLMVLLMRSCSYLGFSWWIAVLGFFSIILATPLPMYMFMPLYQSITLTAPFMLLIMFVYFYKPDRRLIAVYLLLSMILALGAYSASLSMLLIYLGCIMGFEFFRRVFKSGIKNIKVNLLPAFYFSLKHGMVFVIAPFLFFLWQ